MCKKFGCNRQAKVGGLCRTHYNRKTRDDKLLHLVNLLGGRCEMCLSIHNPKLLQFHHRAPSKKKFSISQMIKTYALEKLEKEALKCSLLCANCHATVHIAERFLDG